MTSSAHDRARRLDAHRLILDRPTAPWVHDQLERAANAAPARQPVDVLHAGSAPPSGIDRRDHGTQRDRRRYGQASGTPHTEPRKLARALESNDRVRVLDMLYVVLAHDLDSTLMNTDARLARAGHPFGPPPRSVKHDGVPERRNYTPTEASTRETAAVHPVGQ